MATLTYTGTLTVVTCWCGIAHAVPADLEAKASRDHTTTIYCPLGHSWVYMGETEAQKEKRLRKWAEDRASSERARADQAEASLRTTKGHVTRLRKRVIEGECPFCGQHLRDLARHVGRVHADEQAEQDA